MRKSFLLTLLIILILLIIFITGCEQQSYKKLNENEIKEILSDVVASDKLIEERVLGYFSELSSENNNIIKPAELYEMLQRGEDLFILDIRRKEDYNKGHIENANNIWWFDIGKNLDKLPKDKRIIIMCYTGQSAGQVTGVLSVMGYEITSLAGGMNNGWLKENLPVTTSN